MDINIKSKEVKKTSICFVLPTYNEEANIRQCIESVFSHQNLDQKIIKVLVVDDNSSDNTQKIIRELQDQFSELHMITGEKKDLEMLTREDSITLWIN